MTFFDLHDRWAIANRLLAIIVTVLTMIVSLPLSIKTLQQGGGPWGFGVVGLHILLPLNTYIFFAIPAFLHNKRTQWLAFITAHLVSLAVGITGFVMFPILPKSILLVPISLAAASVIFWKRLPLFLWIMLVLAITANVLLLKWELDFGRSLPIIQIFESVSSVEP